MKFATMQKTTILLFILQHNLDFLILGRNVAVDFFS